MTVLRSIALRIRGGRADPWLLLALGLAVFLPGLGAHDLWNPDEPRYGEVCREMRESGDYLIPQLNGSTYTQKPPLMFWAICAGAAVRGELDATAVRWPSAAAGVGSLLVVYVMGLTLFGRRAARIAVLVAASCVTLIQQGHAGRIDMLLTFLVLCGMLAWVRGYFLGRPSLYPWFFVAAGLATLAKGPVGLLPPLLAIVAFLALQRDRDELRRLRIGRGLVIWAVIVMAWLLPALLHGGREYFDEIVLRQNVTRSVDPWHHFQPFYYYAYVAPMDFLPWTFFLPAGLAAWWTLPTGETRRRCTFILTWAAVTVLFFSVSPAKRGVYVLALYPALALLLGATLDRMAASWRAHAGNGTAPGRSWLAWPGALLALSAAALTIVLPGIAARRPETAPLGEDFPLMIAQTLAPLAAGATLAVLLLSGRRLIAAVAALSGGMIVTSSLVFTLVLPRVDLVKSARPLADIIRAEAAPGEPIGVHPRLDPAFLFYTERRLEPLERPDELAAFARRPGRVWLLAERDSLARLGEPLPLVEVARDNDLRQGYILLTSPSEEAAGDAPGRVTRDSR